jgi:hypothetical protein
VSLFGIAGLARYWIHATSAYLQPKAQVFLEWNLPRIDIDFNDDIYNKSKHLRIIGMGGKYKKHLNPGK